MSGGPNGTRQDAKAFEAVVCGVHVGATEDGRPSITLKWHGGGYDTTDRIVFHDLGHKKRETHERLRSLGVEKLIPKRIEDAADLAPLAKALFGQSRLISFDGERVIYGPKKPDEEGPFAFEYGAELAKPQPPPVWLCPHFAMVRGRPIIIAGYAGSIKTWVAMVLGLAVAAGKGIWVGVPISLHGTVRFIDYENLGETSARRLQRLAYGLDIDLAELGDRIGRVALPRTYLTTEGAEEALVHACQGVDVAVVDSLRAACPGVDENSSEVREYIDLLQRVTAQTGTIFIVLHHEGKQSQETRGRPGLQRMRGSSALADAVDAMLRLEEVGEGNDTFKLESGKHSNGRASGLVTVKIEDVGDQDPRTGFSPGVRLVVVPENGSSDVLNRPSPVRKCADQILALLRKTGRPMGSNQIKEAVSGNGTVKADALKLLREGDEVWQDEDRKYTLKEWVPRRSVAPTGPDADLGTSPNPEKTQVPSGPEQVPGPTERGQVPESPSLRRGPTPPGPGTRAERRKTPGPTGANGASVASPTLCLVCQDHPCTCSSEAEP